jgi:HD-GYP domain-containing protein (c-di-GMP phosphodiesterase class II)
MNTPESVREDLKNAALLHDIGKIGIPESILNKPGHLSEEEMGVIRQHPDIGYRILSPVGSTSGLANVVRHHHERFDGGGYPLGLAGESIPFLSRILTVADSFDAMISDRIYRPSPGMDFAVSELRRCAGSQFDPSIVYAFLDVLAGTEIDRLRSEYASDIQF